jgi:hypothetical protein
MTEPLPTPQEVLDKFIQRDENAVEEMCRFSSRHIEDKLAFTSARAQDTAGMVVYILKYLAQQESEHG